MKASNIAIALTTALTASGTTLADANPFELTELNGGYTIADAAQSEGKCGEGKCGGSKPAKASGEGKCGGSTAEKASAEGKCGGEKAGKAEAEGKCGERKGGSAR